MSNLSQLNAIGDSCKYRSIGMTLAHDLIKECKKRFSANDQIFVYWSMSGCFHGGNFLVDLEITLKKP